MPNYLHRTTLQYLTSTSPNSLADALSSYVENPDMTPVSGVPNKYWLLTGDIVSEMEQADKDVVDAAEAQVQEDSELFELDRGILKRFVLVLLDEINRARTADGVSTVIIAQLKNAMRNK